MNMLFFVLGVFLVMCGAWFMESGRYPYGLGLVLIGASSFLTAFFRRR